MFGRLLYRHRGWEGGNGFTVPPLAHPEHDIPASKAGHWVPGTVMSIAGHIAPVAMARELMGVDWFVPREDLVEAVPVYMTAYVAAHAMAAVSRLAGRITGMADPSITEDSSRRDSGRPPGSAGRPRSVT